MRPVVFGVQNVHKGGVFYIVKFILPQRCPVSDNVPGLLGVQRLLSDADELQGRNVQHFLDGAGVVSPFDDFEGDALINMREGMLCLAELVHGHILELPEIFINFGGQFSHSIHRLDWVPAFYNFFSLVIVLL